MGAALASFPPLEKAPNPGWGLQSAGGASHGDHNLHPGGSRFCPVPGDLLPSLCLGGFLEVVSLPLWTVCSAPVSDQHAACCLHVSWLDGHRACGDGTFDSPSVTPGDQPTLQIRPSCGLKLPTPEEADCPSPWGPTAHDRAAPVSARCPGAGGVPRLHRLGPEGGQGPGWPGPTAAQNPEPLGPALLAGPLDGGVSGGSDGGVSGGQQGLGQGIA